MEEHVIKINIPPGWRGKKYISSTGVMRINLEEIARRCEDPRYKYNTHEEYYAMAMPATDFRKICNLIVKYASRRDYDTAEAVFTSSENDKAARIWTDAKAKFEGRRAGRNQHNA